MDGNNWSYMAGRVINPYTKFEDTRHVVTQHIFLVSRGISAESNNAVYPDTAATEADRNDSEKAPRKHSVKCLEHLTIEQCMCSYHTYVYD